MRNKLGYDPDDDKEAKGDGVFWMSFADFTGGCPRARRCPASSHLITSPHRIARHLAVHFEDIYICRIFKTVDQGGSWYKYTVEGEWKGRTAGGCTNSPEKAQWNPQYFLKISRPANIFVSLLQKEASGGGGEDECIGLKILKKEGKRAKCVYAGESLLATPYCAIREVTAEGKLTPSGTAPFTIFPSTYEPGKELGFIITVFSDVPLEMVDGSTLREIPTTVPAT